MDFMNIMRKLTNSNESLKFSSLNKLYYFCLNKMRLYI